MKYVKNVLVILLLQCICLLSSVHAQKLVSEVTIILDRLPLENQTLLKDLAADIQTYINDYEWTDDNSYELPLTIQIFLMDNSVSYEDRYSGTFLISNNFDLQYYDKYWRFPLEEGYQLEHVMDVFNPFTGFIDFYIYLILASEHDKYGKFFGTPFYEKAKLLSDQALFNARFSTGWEERQELIQFLMGLDNKAFREMKDLYFLGLSYKGEEDDKMLQYCREALNMLGVILEKENDYDDAIQFMKAHHIEMIDIFHNSPEALKQLIRIDPDRASTYQQYLN